jgi:hypothetical protein
MSKLYTEEEIQKRIDEAIKGDFYFHVTDLWKKKAVISGANKAWSAGTDVVYAPDARLCGPKDVVQEMLVLFKIDDHHLYENPDSEGYEEELLQYKKNTKNPQLPEEDEIAKLREKIKGKGDEKSNVDLSSLLRNLPPGKAINVSNIAEKKFTTVAAPLCTTLSKYLAVPGINIVSKTIEAFIEALDQLEVKNEDQLVYLEIITALNKIKKKESVPRKESVKKGTVAKKAAVKSAKSTSSAKRSTAKATGKSASMKK